jgi:peptide/nickel transport system substrate-binding protein
MSRTHSGSPADRRTFGRRTFVRGLGLGSVAVLGLAGCASAVEEQRAAASGATAPVRGGTLNLAGRTDLVPGNFFTNSNDGVTTVIGLVYESLIRYPNDRVEPEPLLATAWTLADDGLSLTLDLRDDVYFHGPDGTRGRQFTSADVEFSLRTYADPKWTAQIRSTAAAITGYDTSDPHRIGLIFAHPLSNIFDLLDTAPIVDTETIDQLGTGSAFVGTGPFRFVSWTPNSKIVFARNDHYRVPDRPYLDGVEFTVVSDSQAILAGVRTGQYDVAGGLAYRDVQNLDGSDGFRAITLEGAELQTYVGANVTAPGLSDLRVRQAIAYALDRQRIVDEVLRGSGYAVNLPWPKYSPAWDEQKNATYSRDVERAKALVAEVGSVPTIPYNYPAGDPVHEATAQIVQANLAEAGIPVTLEPLESAQFTTQLIGAQFPGIWTTYHSWAQYTPSTLTVSAYPFNAQRNASNYVSPDYQAAANAAWQPRGADDAATRAAYDTLNDELLKGLFLVEIGVVFRQWAASDRAQGISWTKRSEITLTDVYKAVGA